MILLIHRGLLVGANRVRTCGKCRGGHQVRIKQMRKPRTDLRRPVARSIPAAPSVTCSAPPTRSVMPRAAGALPFDLLLGDVFLPPLDSGVTIDFIVSGSFRREGFLGRPLAANRRVP